MTCLDVGVSLLFMCEEFTPQGKKSFVELMVYPYTISSTGGIHAACHDSEYRDKIR